MKEQFIVRNPFTWKVYEVCLMCNKLVRVNKFLLGDLHFCLTPEEIKQKERARGYERNA